MKDEFVPKPACLSSTEALNAQAILDCFLGPGRDLATDAISKVFKGKRCGWVTDVFADEDKEGKQTSQVARFIVYLPNDIAIELDFFGGYLKDGHSCLWIEREVSRGVLIKHLEAGSLKFGTHVFLYGRSDMLSVKDVTPELIRKSTEDHQSLWLQHQVELFGRSRDGLTAELQQILAVAKRFR